jgi:hypothetical protein
MPEFVYAYALTVIIETVIAILLLRGRYDKTLIVRNSIIANSLTLPFVWFLFPVLGFGSWWLQTAVAEVFAFVAEAVVYRALFPKIGLTEALKVSLACNVASFLAGLAVL